MTLYTKSIRDLKTPEEGVRVCVMGRLTENDGKTLLPQNYIDTIDVWDRRLAPPPGLYWKLHKGKINQQEYNQEILKYLLQQEQQKALTQWGGEGLKGNVTFACYEPKEEVDCCHRKTEAEQCKVIFPELEIILG